ncbi:MAG: peptide chain release factor N(5)-glutamine methyltransferase [Moorea sp. SIO2B7]|nr:peptide chain release factor N(5)-glutamine methyltransferase [Moorena sp. SIO2B7]
MNPTVKGQKLSLWRHKAKQEAIAANVSPSEVDWLIQEVTDLDSLALRLESFKERSHIPIKKSLPLLSKLWQRRLRERLPVQYLVGVTPWRHFSLKVSPDVLIPRPETEYLIDLVVRVVKESQGLEISSGNWVDLGTGSGAIAIGLAEVLTKATIYAVDCSAIALEIAQENAENLGFARRIKFYQGCWWEPLESLKGRVNGMISNPPYIPTDLVSQLQPEVVNHEPILALDGGSDGLDHIRHLIKNSPDYLCPGGIWLIEMMAGQAEIVAQMLDQQGSYTKINIFPDLAGIDRFALAYRS